MSALSPLAIAGSTYVVTVQFYDEAGNAITPTSATWTLAERDGDIVNGRQNVPITPLSSQVQIVLSGDDLPAGGVLRFLVEGRYNSTLGSDLPFRDGTTIRVIEP